MTDYQGSLERNFARVGYDLSKILGFLTLLFLIRLHGAEIDVPMAALYSFADYHEAKKLKATDSPTPSSLCVLEGVCGIPRGHELAPERIDLDQDEDVSCLLRHFREAAERPLPFTVPIEEASQKLLGNLCKCSFRHRNLSVLLMVA